MVKKLDDWLSLKVLLFARFLLEWALKHRARNELVIHELPLVESRYDYDSEDRYARME